MKGFFVIHMGDLIINCLATRYSSSRSNVAEGAAGPDPSNQGPFRPPRALRTAHGVGRKNPGSRGLIMLIKDLVQVILHGFAVVDLNKGVLSHRLFKHLGLEETHST